MEHIRRIAKAMDRVVDCIPARYYLANEPAWQQLPGVDDATPTSQVIQRLARAAGKQKKGKKKLGKQMQAENPNLVRKGNDKRKKKDASSSLTSDGKEEGEDHDPMADYESLDLRGKLQAKIASLRQQRKDQQRARDLERRKERQGSEAQQVGAPNKKQKDKDHRDGHNAEKKSKSKTAAEAFSAEPTAEAKASEAGARAAAADDGTSSLEFGNVGVAKQTLDTSYHQPLKGSKWKRIDKTLRDQERKDKKLDKLPEDEKQTLIHDERMEKAMLRATGEKVKDDKNKLKKTVKKHDHKMAKSSGGGAGAGGVSGSAAGAAGGGGKGSGGKGGKGSGGKGGKGSGGKGGKGGKEKGSGKGGGKEKGSGKGSFGKGKGKRKHGFEGGGRRVLNSDKDL
eukprot:g8437.t1